MVVVGEAMRGVLRLGQRVGRFRPEASAARDSTPTNNSKAGGLLDIPRAVSLEARLSDAMGLMIQWFSKLMARERARIAAETLAARCGPKSQSWAVGFLLTRQIDSLFECSVAIVHRQGSIVLVAAGGDRLFGMLSFHIIPLMHADGFLGRVTSLVVPSESADVGSAADSSVLRKITPGRTTARA